MYNNGYEKLRAVGENIGNTISSLGFITKTVKVFFPAAFQPKSLKVITEIRWDEAARIEYVTLSFWVM